MTNPLPDKDIATLHQEEVMMDLKKKCDLGSAKALIEDKLKTWMDVDLNIAFIGDSGVGKSSLINAFRGFLQIRRAKTHLLSSNTLDSSLGLSTGITIPANAFDKPILEVTLTDNLPVRAKFPHSFLLLQRPWGKRL